ncbi:MAG: hypothetical protein AAGA54_19880 [Myxococcota bacterium]
MGEPRAVVPSFERLRAYLAQLPAGLDSFPECQAKASVHRRVLAYSKAPLLGLPEPLQTLVDDPPPANTWIPQCQALALIVAAVEAQQVDGPAENAWIQAAAGHVFNSPMYRILMWAATPRLLFKGAHLRWSAFFRGSTLSATVDGSSAEIVLDCPHQLFTVDLARIFEHVLCAAAHFTEDGEGTIALELFRPGSLLYRGTW